MSPIERVSWFGIIHYVIKKKKFNFKERIVTELLSLSCTDYLQMPELLLLFFGNLSCAPCLQTFTITDQKKKTETNLSTAPHDHQIKY